MPSPPLDSDELVRHAAQGDDRAARLLLEKYRTRLNRMVAVRMDPRVRGRIDPSDVIQETLTAASQRMNDYLAQQPIAFYPWLRQIAWEKLSHEHDRHLRAAKRSVTREQFFRPVISDESAQGLAERFLGIASSPSSVALRGELRQRVRDALAKLKDKDREVLLMRYLEQLSSQEISAILNISESAVNMRHMRALERMHRVLIHEMGED